MKEGWKYLPLGAICNILNGYAFKSANYVSSGIRVIRIANVQKGMIVDTDPQYYPFESESTIAKYLLNEGDLLVSLTGNVGRVGIIPKKMMPAALNQRVACLRLHQKDVLFKYLFHYLNSDQFEELCIRNSTGAAQLNLSTVWLAKQPVPVPSLSEQQQIVDFLDAEFAKIDELKNQAEQSLQNAKDLFQAALKEMLTPKEGWKEQVLGTLGESKVGPFGSLLHKKDYVENGTPLINPMHIGNGKIIPDSNFSVSEEKLQELQSFVMLENDIVIGRRGEMGRCAVVTKAEEGFVCGTGSIYFRPNTKKVLPLFLQLYLSSDLGKTKLEKVAGGATMLNLSSKALNGLIISIPTIETQIDIIDNLKNLKDKVDSLQSNYSRTVQLCADLKQALLRQVFE